jgi:hypothetical protein
MATYVNDLRLKEITTGDEAGTWGTSTNTNLELIGEALGYGTQNCFSSNANATTTVADGATDPARAMYFKVTSSATLTATRILTIAPNTISRVMLIENATTGGQAISISQGTGSNVIIPNGQTKMVYLDGAGAGAAVVDATQYLTVGRLSINSSLPILSLDDNSTTNSYFSAYHDGGDTTLYSRFGSNYGEFKFQVDNGTASINQLAITSDGVGIGTTSPANLLHVKGASAGALELARFRLEGATNNPMLKIEADEANQTAGIDVSGSTATELTFSVGGSEKARIDGSGNVGIGTSSPSGVLHLAANTAATTLPSIVFEDTGTTSTRLGSLTNDNGDLVLAMTASLTDLRAAVTLFDDRKITFSTNASERMRIDSSGNVGIGTTSPATALDVNGTVTADALTVEGVTTIKDSVAPYIKFEETGVHDAYLGVDEGNLFIRQGGLGFNSFNIASNNDISFYGATGTTTGFFWDASAEALGIGTTSPGVSLHVDASAGGAIRASRSSVSANYIQMDHDGTNGTVRASGANALIFDTNSGERMRIDASGNIGIGTASPSAKLEVEDEDFARLDLNLSDASGTTIADVRGLVTGSEKWRLGKTASASDDFTINVAGSEAMRIDTSGNVGIGSNSPGFVTGSGLEIQRITATATVRLEYTGSNAFELSAEQNTVTYNSVSSKPHVFEIGSSEKMRLDASGNLLVGTTSKLVTATDDAIVLKVEGGSETFIGIRHDAGAANGNYFAGFSYNGTVIGSIAQSGTTAVSYNTSSDARLKENIADAEDAGAKVDAIQVRQFDWKADGSHQDYGMIAQELMTVAPEAVSGDPESDDMMGVDYSKLVPMMLKEIQSLRARVAQLEGA